MTRSFRRLALVAVAVVGAVLVAPVAAHADAAPTVVITSVDGANPPVPGQTVSGPITVLASASTDLTGTDTVSMVELFADLNGVPSANNVDVATCSTQTCDVSLGWDTTGFGGAFTLRVVVTALTTGTGSDTATVSVSSPGPTASVTSPGTNATVNRTVSVGVRGRVDPTQTDQPTSVDLRVDGNLVGTFACGSGKTCNGSVSWDTTGFGPTASLVAVVHTQNGLSSSSSAVVVNVNNPTPSVSITNPTGGATVSGTVFVDVSASTDSGLSDFPTGLSLLVDGTVVDTRSCTPAVHVCSSQMSWDATGLTGSHTFVARLSTSKPAVTTDSAPVTVSVTTPSSLVQLVGLAANAVAVGAGASATSSGIVGVPITVSTDSRLTEFPNKVELLVNAIVVDATTCPVKVHVCSATLRWDARRAAGPYDVAARLTTTRSIQSTSRTIPLFARSGSRTAFYRTSTSAYLGVVTVRGRVVATTTNAGMPGVWVKITRVPAIGKAVALYVRSGFGGAFTYRFRVSTNTTVIAAVGNTWLTRSKGLTIQRVLAPLVCSTAVTTVRAGAVGTGRCVVRYEPSRTVVVLRYYFAGRWATLAIGRTKAWTIPFSFTFPRRGTYLLRVSVGSSRVYVATAGRLMKVVVR